MLRFEDGTQPDADDDRHGEYLSWHHNFNALLTETM